MTELTKDYGVFGDYGYASETLLFESNSVNEAIEWAERYTRWGDMGGYNIIEVAFFATDGTYETTWVMNADEITDEMEEGYLYDEY